MWITSWTSTFLFYIMLKFKVTIYFFLNIFKACAVVLSGRAKRRSWAQASRRRYMGKYINWILWLKEKACWQEDKVYWKQGDHVEVCFLFTFSSYEKVLVLCEKWLSKFSSNLYVLRPSESEKRVFTKVSVCSRLCAA